MQKVLLVSHNFPPTAGPESGLVRMNAEFLHRAGKSVRVLTTTAAHATQAMDPSMLNGFPSEIAVDRVPSPEAVLTSKFPRVGRTLAVWTGRYVLPEVYLPWMFPATSRAVQIVREWHPDVLYSRATKHVSNVVGWRLKKRTGLPWVAHFSDPWISSGLYKRPMQRWIGGFWERRILRDADALVFVTEQAAECSMRALPAEWKSRVHVVPHGYDPLPTSLVRQQPGGSRPLKMIHAGAFYPTMRSPDSLIAALALLESRRPLAGLLEITCIGVDTTCFQPLVDAAGVGHVLKLEPGIPFDECQARIAGSDAILIIDTPGFGGVFLPTKLIEGFAFQKPVLGLAEPASAVTSTLKAVDQPWAPLDDPEAIAERLSRLLDEWERDELRLTTDQVAKLQTYEIDQVNKPLLEIFQRFAKR